ncbi:cell division protein DamX [Superficieibacter electus]|uniref:Cell division protein DamX n=1 Tax=Superficieibacter electus TaxID=2022662 RepID=A0A2P5GK79_9ENTR|nr:cell division protein DamX [Superficieibacter electus]POP43216.1 cell division protein DamX [Superficieibacter electus]POP44769.1 cell division protein DamX [Superficieibacter electus]
MDEFKPEDELKPDPSDRRTGRSRQASDRDSDPQINFDEVELDADEPRSTRATRRAREEDDYEADDEAFADEEPVERRPRKRKKAPVRKPASRQYIMMGVGIVVLLLLIAGIGSALKSPSKSEPSSTAEKNISLSGDQENTAPPASGQTANTASQDVSLPPISSTPTEGQAPSTPENQQRVEVQGDLNNALTQQQGQVDTAVNSTLPTEPATVAAVRNGNAPRQATSGESTERHNATTRPERKQAVIEPKPQTKPQQTAKQTVTEPKPVAQPKRTETTTAPVKAPTATAPAPKATATTTVPTTTAPAATAPAATASTPAATTAPAATAGAKSAGNVGSLKSAPSSHYTLQLSSSSSYDNLNGWAKKENLKNYVVYQTTRNGQPWYVLVSGVYASKDDAKRAVTELPADVQAKNPWAKPLHQVQADLK